MERTRIYMIRYFIRMSDIIVCKVNLLLPLPCICKDIAKPDSFCDESDSITVVSLLNSEDRLRLGI